MDQWLLDFVGKNWLTISFALVLLKGVAKITPWAQDDEIVQILTGAFDLLRARKTNGNGGRTNGVA